MGNSKERIPSSLVKSEEYHLSSSETIEDYQTFAFGMSSNGYFQNSHGEWRFDETLYKRITKDKTGQYISFLGPGNYTLLGLNRSPKSFVEGLSQGSFTKAIRRLKDLDEETASNVAFSIGNVIRFSSKVSHPINTTEAIEYVSQKANLADLPSVEALTDAMVMYALSGGPLTEDNMFKAHLYHMSEAVSEDPVQPITTEDLGLSQVSRIHSFLRTIHNEPVEPIPNINTELEVFSNFPTVGAEFHFPLNTANERPNFWQRLALLNMSQYQKGSYIQLSRNDRDVIEVRMNPSDFPVTIANWNHMRQILPEINKSFFTVTYNNKEPKKDFKWENYSDESLLKKLSALGYLCYADVFESIPQQEKREEINFGTVYLGQTVRKTEKGFDYTGHWTGNEQSNGQFAIYSGFGENFINLAYYPTMALAKPSIITPEIHEEMRKVYNLKNALDLGTERRRAIFSAINEEIQNDKELSAAHKSAYSILDTLNI